MMGILEHSHKMSLHMLANRFGTDKAWLHHYMDEYEKHFGLLRDLPINLLEIGIGGYSIPGRGGHSLRMWGAYFEKGQITGIDIEDKSFVDRGNIKTVIADQTNEEALKALNADRGPFRIIIDDGSHVQDHILKTFFILFPMLEAGGIYVIEDLATAYMEHYGGGPYLPSPNAIGLVQRLIDGLHWESWGKRHQGPTPIDRMIKGIHVTKELVFIYKKLS